ncbi:MAG: DUF3597 domain-containing protein [Verrucomicrobiota bacterium]
MSLFKTILSKIFDHDAPAASALPPVSPPPATPAQVTPDTTQASELGTTFGAAAGSAFGNSSSTPAVPSTQPVSTHPASVDVASIMDRLAAANPEKLDWKRSIVDLMKLLDMDSSLTARKELAAELGYPGDTSNSAGMNTWLHQQVLRKLTENGGKVPADLLV